MNKRLFKLSDEYFHGYEVEIDLDECDSIDEISVKVKNELLGMLRKQKLEMLIKILEKKRFHIHDETFGSILIKENYEIVWICCDC